MKYNNSSKQDYYLNEYSYEQLKIANKMSLEILEDFVSEMFEMFLDINKYIVRPYSVINILDNIRLKGNKNYKHVEYFLELSINEQVKKSNKTTEIYRYYTKEFGIIIHSLIYYKECLLKVESKKIIKYLTMEGKKERDQIRLKAMNKLKKLQDELFYAIDNDPTVD